MKPIILMILLAVFTIAVRAQKIRHVKTERQIFLDSIKTTDKYKIAFKKFGVKYALNVCIHNPKVGMTENMILFIEDNKYPTKINTSHYSFGTNSQWVYLDDFIPAMTHYYYFQNGRLSSWQN